MTLPAWIAAIVALALVAPVAWTPPAEPGSVERDSMLVTLKPAIETRITFEVDEAGPVAFSMQKRSGADGLDVEVDGLQACDGIHARGVWIATLALSRPPRELPVCGVFDAGLHVMHITSPASASVWALYIEGATWSEVELDSLGQGQIPPPVDGVRLPAHVLAPAVAA